MHKFLIVWHDIHYPLPASCTCTCYYAGRTLYLNYGNYCIGGGACCAAHCMYTCACVLTHGAASSPMRILHVLHKSTASWRGHGTWYRVVMNLIVGALNSSSTYILRSSVLKTVAHLAVFCEWSLSSDIPNRMRGFCLLLVVFATLYRLASAQSSPIQRRLIAEQEDIACTLKEDRDLLRTQFEYMIRALHGVQPNFSELASYSCVDLRSDILMIVFTLNFYSHWQLAPHTWRLDLRVLTRKLDVELTGGARRMLKLFGASICIIHRRILRCAGILVVER